MRISIKRNAIRNFLILNVILLLSSCAKPYPSYDLNINKISYEEAKKRFLNTYLNYKPSGPKYLWSSQTDYLARFYNITDFIGVKEFDQRNESHDVLFLFKNPNPNLADVVLFQFTKQHKPSGLSWAPFPNAYAFFGQYKNEYYFVLHYTKICHVSNIPLNDIDGNFISLYFRNDECNSWTQKAQFVFTDSKKMEEFATVFLSTFPFIDIKKCKEGLQVDICTETY